ncbi:hypothetical protein SASPL_117114 [Salvia splendens]|uniref:Transmembrane protein n=1 Tax=Salvia splendens TaxID=180675 RepID=A0A8X8XV57_SALSN|nr:hypothetical protein SASPL_157867 [Salvia splendens]KAG6420580.1 hypothetical protein SASPL_117114 [Salvia splendens]
MCGGGDDDDCRCRPLGFLLGLPFAFVALILSLVGVVIWIVGYLSLSLSLSPANLLKFRILLSIVCPCCLCVTVIVELALALIKAPFSVIKWFTKQIPC